MPRSKVAQAASAKRHYERNKDAIKARAIAYKRDHKVQMSALVNAAKTRPCADCGGDYPACVMDFDHVRGTKSANVSQLVARSVSEQRIRAEIAKCEVVCANCHRLRTFDRAGRTDSVSVS